MSNESAAIYFNYIRERQSIQDKRSAGQPAPWTNDPVLSTRHFCNNRREDDRVTKELRKVVVGANLPLHALPGAYTLARLFNRASTLSIALENMPNWLPAVKAHRAKGELIFHVAYVVSTCGKRMDKLEYVDGVVNAVNLVNVPMGSLSAAFNALRSVDGLGSFLAGQVVADLKNDRYLAEAYDWSSWSCPGPGSLKGLEYIFDRPVTAKMYDHYMAILQQALPEDIRAMKLHSQDLQNTLCEFSKYWRYINKMGGRQRVFSPRVV